jgi:hypothetical protein
VIRQASETQAPKLRSLAPSLDRDLETICARCLERDPKARYQSAGDLAADLERWLDGRPIVARPVSPPTRIWRWSQRNPKLVGAATAGVLLGAAAVWLFRGEPHEQPGSGVYDRYVQGLLTDVTQPPGKSSIGISVPVQNPSNPFTVADYTSPGDLDPRPLDTRVTAAPPGTGFTTSVHDRAWEADLRTNKITADVIAAPPETAFNTSVRDRASEASLRTNKVTTDVTATPPERAFNTSVRDRAPEPGVRMNKITADGSASIQGFVKDAKGEPIKGTDVRIESRDGKQVFSTVKTDSKGRYISQGLQPGVYQVTLLVNGAVKASILNTQTKANQPTQLNFDLKPTSQAGNIAKGGKHMVWVPSRTGSHIGGNWVEVDDEGEAHSGSNIQTITTRTW